MDESNKIKYIVIGSVSLLLLIVIFLFVRGCNNMNTGKETSSKARDISTSVRDNTQTDQIMETIGNAITSGSMNDASQGYVAQSDFNQEYMEMQDAERVQQALREQVERRYAGYDRAPDDPTTQPRVAAPERVEYAQQTEQNSHKETSSDAVSQEPANHGRFFSGKSQSSALPYLEVFGEQRIKTGDRLKLIAPGDIRVDNLTIPKGTIIYAQVNIGDRANVSIKNVTVNGKMFALQKNLLDNDGVAGINIGQVKEEDNLDAVRKGEEVVNAVPIGYGMAGSVLRTVSSSVSVLFGNNKNEMEVIIQGNYKLFIQ